MTPRGPGRPRETSHAEIREAAFKLFLEHGYTKTSLARIAAAVGISRTTLFTYFPAKRDLIWEDFDRHSVDIDEFFASRPDQPLIEVLLGAMLTTADYRSDERSALAQRRRIAEEDDELRAYTALAVQNLITQISSAAAKRSSGADGSLVDLVTRALVAAATQCTDDWATSELDTDLAPYMEHRLRPLVNALGPLLA